MKRTPWLALFVWLLASGPGLAQEALLPQAPAEPAPAVAPPAAAMPEKPAQSPAQLRRQADPSADRNILLPSAETVEKGDLTLNSYELFLAGITYGITDSLQMSLTTLLPITTEIPLVVLGAAKIRLIKSDRFVLSLVPTGSVISSDGQTMGSVGLGVYGDVILDDLGKWVFSFSETNIWGFGHRVDDSEGDAVGTQYLDGILFALSLAMNYRVHEYIKVLTELILPGGVVNGDWALVEEGLLLGYGVRFFGRTLAVDLSFLRPLHPDVDDQGLLMGFPYLTFSARF